MTQPADTNTRQRQKADTQNKILQSAIAEFARAGFEAASLAAIGASAGVKKALVQYHFPSKELLWQAAATRLLTGRNERLAHFMQESSGSAAPESLRPAFTAVVEYTRENPEWLWFMFHEAAIDSERRSWLIEHFLRTDYLLGEDFICQCQAAGLMRSGPPLHILHLISGALTYNLLVAPITLAATGTDLASRESIDQQVDLLLRMLEPA